MKKVLSLLIVVLLLVSYCFWTLTKPLPALQPAMAKNLTRASASPASLSWPTSQAAAGLLDTDILDTYGPQTPAAMASTAKVITLLVILDKKPLALNETGPTITLSQADVDRYRGYTAQDGSVVPVTVGEKLTEYQAVQAIMLPSANNIADSLAIWAFGSLDNYSKAANAYLAEHKFKDTHVGSDASGLSPDTTSTAADLVRIGKLAMQNPVLSQVASQSSATGIPLTTEIRNVNVLLGINNIIGIKTGNSDQAGGAFLGAANVIVNGQPQTVITAVMKAADLGTALRQSLQLIKSAQTNFTSIPVAKKGEAIGYYYLPWSGRVAAIADKDLDFSIWNGSRLAAKPVLEATKPDPQAGQTVGQLTVQTTSNSKIVTVPLKLQTTPSNPPILWRLTHPF